MRIYGKMAANAVAAMSYLAESYADKGQPVATLEIANKREISRPLLGKVLTTLSQAGLVKGSPGPKGGFALTKHPSEISLASIVKEFEPTDRPLACPFGPNYCGNHAPCPLHDELAAFRAKEKEFLEDTDLSVFQYANSLEKGA